MDVGKNKNINVAIIEPVGGYGGMQYYNIGLLKGLSPNVNSVYIFSSHISYPRKEDNIFIYNTFNKVWATKNKLIKLIYYVYSLIKCLLQAYRKKCNIIHIHQFHFSFFFILNISLIRIFFKKIVLTIHDVESFDNANNQKSRYIEKVFYSLISAFIVHNKYSLNKLSTKIDTNKIHIIKHGNYIPFVEKLKNTKSDNTLNILFFGQLKKVKGLDVLLKALAKFKLVNSNFKLHVAGRIWRDDFSYYQNIIDDNNLSKHVLFDLRYIPDNELSEIFNKSNLIVLPYKAIYQSGVLLKSMSYGRAVLCSDLPPFKEDITDNINGFLFESENPQSLATKLNYIISNIYLLNDIENAGYDHVLKHNDWMDIGLSTKTVYENLLFKNSVHHHNHTKQLIKSNFII